MKFHPAAWIAAFVVPQHHQQHPTSTTKLTSRTSTVSTTTSTALSMVPIDIQQQQLLLPPTLLQYQTTTTTTTTAHDVVRPSFVLQDGIQHWLQDNIGVPPAVAASSTPSAPTREEITLLRQAFATFYGTDRDPVAAEPLLTKTIEAWQRQPPDESAGLYRVRGDCYMVSRCFLSFQKHRKENEKENETSYYFPIVVYNHFFFVFYIVRLYSR